MNRFKLLTRSVPLWLALLLLAICIVSGVALTLTIIVSVERVGLWQKTVASPHFTVTEISTTIRGLNRVDVKITLKNIDTDTYNANVTVQLLDSNGDVIAEAFQLTGDIAGGAEWSYTFIFKTKNIVKSYESVLVIVKELS
ncbi:MAG: FxLYD domain-containing protein [Desulfurococcaceae archaeon]|nr:FxLYD domain-containing protein [Desulfurococcaceae archaeon]